MIRRSLILLLTLAAALPALAGKGKLVIINADRGATGFNDPTPVAPVGGNQGTTVGAQRLIVIQAAAARWSGLLDTDVDVVVDAAFATPLDCEQTVLAQAGPLSWQRDFAAAPRANTWYPIALANKLAGRDLLPSSGDIILQFNVSLDDATCLGDTGFYYGLDNNHGSNVDLFNVALHEIAHGLGVLGGPQSDGGRPSIHDHYTLDRSSGRNLAQMNAAEKRAALTNTGNLVWTGDNVRANTSMFLLPVTTLAVTEPSAALANYDIGTAAFGASPAKTALSGKVVRATDAANDDGPSATDGCTALTNADAMAGNLALIDRGDCTFVEKARNAQAAGAKGVIIADRERETCQPPGMSGEAPDITIPVVSIGTDDGDALKNQLGQSAAVHASLRVDPSQFGGTSREGWMRLYAPCTFDPGSTRSHWDIVSSPNLLMEPSINNDLLHGVDLTIYQLLDIGWTMPARSGRRFGR